MHQGSHRRFTGRPERRGTEGDRDQSLRTRATEERDRKREVKRGKERERKMGGGQVHLLKGYIVNVHSSALNGFS